MIGRIIGNYQIQQKLGEGGMGSVYRAVDLMLDRDVAIKVLRPELLGHADIVDRFRSEAVTLAKLHHPNIATLFSLLREEGEMMMVMEFVRGQTLDSLLEQLGVIAPGTAVTWCCQVLEAMQYAHRKGVVHRDIKPANLMITDEGLIKVTDFGIARVLGESRKTRTGHIIGTVTYMSPEQIRGQDVDARADLYALGAVLFELLTGRPPFAADNEFSLMNAHINTPAPLARALGVDVPDWLDAAMQRALAKGPLERFQTATDFRAMLAEGQRGSRVVRGDEGRGARCAPRGEGDGVSRPGAADASGRDSRFGDACRGRSAPDAAGRRCGRRGAWRRQGNAAGGSGGGSTRRGGPGDGATGRIAAAAVDLAALRRRGGRPPHPDFAWCLPDAARRTGPGDEHVCRTRGSDAGRPRPRPRSRRCRRRRRPAVPAAWGTWGTRRPEPRHRQPCRSADTPSDRPADKQRVVEVTPTASPGAPPRVERKTPAAVPEVPKPVAQAPIGVTEAPKTPEAHEGGRIREAARGGGGAGGEILQRQMDRRRGRCPGRDGHLPRVPPRHLHAEAYRRRSHRQDAGLQGHRVAGVRGAQTVPIGEAVSQRQQQTG